MKKDHWPLPAPGEVIDRESGEAYSSPIRHRRRAATRRAAFIPWARGSIVVSARVVWTLFASQPTIRGIEEPVSFAIYTRPGTIGPRCGIGVGTKGLAVTRWFHNRRALGRNRIAPGEQCRR